MNLGRNLRLDLDWADILIDNRAYEESKTEIPRELVAAGTPPMHERSGLLGVFRLQQRSDFQLAVEDNAIEGDLLPPLSTLSYHLLHKEDAPSSVVMLWEYVDGWRGAYAFTPSMVPGHRTPEQLVREIADAESDSPLDWLTRASIAAAARPRGETSIGGQLDASPAVGNLAHGELRALILGGHTLRRAMTDPDRWFGEVPPQYGSIPSVELVEWAAAGMDSASEAMELGGADWTPGLVLEARAAGFAFRFGDDWSWLLEAGIGEWAHDYSGFFTDLFAMKEAGWSEAAMRQLHREPRPPLPTQVQSLLRPEHAHRTTSTAVPTEAAARALNGLSEPMRAWFRAWVSVAGGPRAASFWIGAGYKIEEALASVQSGRAPDFSALER